MAYAFLSVWFIFTMLIGWAESYKTALIRNIIATLSFTVYGLLIDQVLAALIFLIACSNSVIQLALPQSENLRNKQIRNAVAVLVAVIASILLYENWFDLIICAGFACIRLGEAQQSAKRMQAGLATGFTLYIIFGALEGLYLMAALQAVIVMTFLYRLRKDKIRTVE